MIYERQIKRAIDYFYLDDRLSFNAGNENQDFFVISALDPTVLLDYASVSHMNNTLESISDPF